MFIVFYTVILCVFVYLWLFPHPIVFVMYFGIHGMYVCMYVCMYVVCLNVSPKQRKPIFATSVTQPHINQGMYLPSFVFVVYNCEWRASSEWLML
jgi:hypothetical protein